MKENSESRTLLKVAVGVVVGWFVLMTIWPVTFWWFNLLDRHLHLGGQP